MQLSKIPANSQFSWSDGFWFIFNDNDRTIAVNASAFSGKERVFVNNELVADKRSLGMTSTHQFFYEESIYIMIFKVANLLTGKIECSLIKDDVCIGKFRTSMRKKFSLNLLTASLIGGGIAGFVVAYFNLSLWFVAAIVIIWLSISTSKTSAEQFKIDRLV